MQRIFQERVLSHRRAEYDRLKEEREERISQLLQSRKQERETKRKRIYFLRCEEERQKKLHEEEETRKLEGTSLSFKLRHFFSFLGQTTYLDINNTVSCFLRGMCRLV